MPDTTYKPKRKEKEKRALSQYDSVFIGIAATLLLPFVIGIGLVIALATGVIRTGPSEFDILSSPIPETNVAVARLIEGTNQAATQSAELTQVIVEATETPTVTNTPEITATFCAWQATSLSDIKAAETVKNALLAAAIPVESVTARSVGEYYMCEGNHLGQPFPAQDVSLEIIFSRQAQTLDDETRGNTVAAVLEVVFSAALKPFRDITVGFPPARWSMPAGDAHTAYESGAIGTALWALGAQP